MYEWFINQNPILQAFLAGCFTWGVTALGAGLVFFFKTVNQKVLDSMLGFAGGIMVAASFWSLLAPAIQMSEGKALPSWVPPLIGFLMGCGFLMLVDKILPHVHLGFPSETAEGVKTSWSRSILLVLAITLHNIPEGLAVGVAFGAAASGFPEASIAGAIALTLGIGIQNFPEGTAVSVPLRREGLSVAKAFQFGQFSGMVEPIAAVIGAAAVIVAQPILPYALAFAAGAMIFVVIEEVVPESQISGNSDLSTLFFIVGFSLMMTLDVALG